MEAGLSVLSVIAQGPDPICGGLPALSIADLSLLRPSSAASSSAGFLALGLQFYLGLILAILLTFPSLLPRASLALLLTLESSATCMSVASSSDDVVELTLRLRGLRISIQGPALRATELAGRIPDLLDSPSARSVVSEAAQTSVLSFAPSTAQTGVRQAESRAEVLASFGSAPAAVLELARRLGGGFETPDFRVRRAWLAGCWARAVLSGRVQTPNRSEPISHRSRIYVVLRGGRGALPACFSFSSSQAYWACVGRLSDETVTHAFPSETEAKIYVEAAGFDYPGLQ